MTKIGQGVSAYWNGSAQRFDGAASHLRHDADWTRVLEAAFAAKGPLEVVDFGTGTGACALIAAALGHTVTGVDGSTGMLAVAKARAEAEGLSLAVVNREIEDAGLAPASADVVTIRNVLWTLEHPRAVLALARDVIRPGGRIVVSDGYWAEAHSRSDYDAGLAAALPFHKGLRETEARALLAEAGFGAVEGWHHLFPSHPYAAMGEPPFFVLSATR